MFHWTTVAMFCLISAFSGFMIAAVLSMARDERKIKKEKDNG